MGEASGAATLQLGDFMEAYWETRSVKKSTMKGYHNLKKHIVMLTGRACDVRPADVQQRMVDEQKRGVGAATISDYKEERRRREIDEVWGKDNRRLLRAGEARDRA